MKRRATLKHLLMCTMLGILGGCTISTPFKGPGVDAEAATKSESQQQVVVGLTYIRTGEDGKKNRVFWRHVDNVYQNMEKQHGLIGYAIRREFFGDQGWTMSVWQDTQSLDRFVASPVHREAMQAGLPALSETAFVRLTINRTRIPLSWEEVETYLNKQGRRYEHAAAD